MLLSFVFTLKPNGLQKAAEQNIQREKLLKYYEMLPWKTWNMKHEKHEQLPQQFYLSCAFATNSFIQLEKFCRERIHF